MLQGFRVLRASRAKEAKNKLENEEYNLVLFEPDISPDSTSDIMRFLRGGGSMNMKTPVVLIPKNLSMELSQNNYLPIDYVLPKPFTLLEFWTVISGYFTLN